MISFGSVGARLRACIEISQFDSGKRKQILNFTASRLGLKSTHCLIIRKLSNLLFNDAVSC